MLREPAPTADLVEDEGGIYIVIDRLAWALMKAAERDIKALRSIGDEAVFADEIFRFQARQAAGSSREAIDSELVGMEFSML